MVLGISWLDLEGCQTCRNIYGKYQNGSRNFGGV
jgi:hypothetical protein